VVTLPATLLLANLAFSSGLPPRQTEDEGVIRVTTRLVLVDVVVADDDGPVRDLTIDDFRIFDEGQEREIDVFTFTEVSTGERLDEPLPAGVVSNRYDADGRTTASATIILIDRLNTSPFDQPFADQQLHEFLSTLTEDDRVAIYELTNTLRLVQDYTSDVELLERRMQTSRTAQTIGLEGSEGTLDNRPDPALSALVEGENTAQAAFNELVERTYLQLRADTSAAALEAITARLSDLPGRKSIVWLSGSFPFSFNPHMHTSFQSLVTASSRNRMEEVGRFLTNANVAVYPVFAPGLGSGEPPGLDLMLDLAQKTGGRAFYNTNGLATSMRRAADEARAVYTLGFYVAENVDDDFHEIRIDVGREGLDVRHREGYFGFAEELPGVDDVSLMELLIRPTDDAGIGLFGTSRESGTNGIYDVVLQVNVRDLSLAFDGEFRHGRLESAMVFQPIGEEARILPVEQMPFHMSGEMFERALESGFNVIREVDTEGRMGWLRVVIRDATTGEAGSLRIPLGVD